MEILQPLWRGRSISLRKDSSGTKYTAMSGKDSLLYVPVEVQENSVYKITIELFRESGNGIVYCNLYGNKNFDFPASKIECNRTGWCTFDVDICSKSFPKTVPMMFRLWRAPNGTGTLLVKKVVVELISGKIKPQREGTLISVQKAPAKSRRKLKTNPKRIPGMVPVPTSQELGLKYPKRGGAHRHPRQEIIPLLPIGKFMPKVGPLAPGIDGIKNSVIISIKNRGDFLDRTLYTFAKQTMPKKEFEIVIVDDDSTDDLLDICKKHSSLSGLQFQYIKINTAKGAIPQKGFTPALSNNIGFKKARGSVFIITGPESLQKETNMELTWKACHGPNCIYGIVYRAPPQFVDGLRSDRDWHSYTYLNQLLQRCKPPLQKESTGGFWWYYAATRKEYIIAVNGVDERYMEGICGEDDDFAYRMKFLGLNLAHNHDIFCIHQDHSREDKKDFAHRIRFHNAQWRILRSHNLAILLECRKSGNPIVNKDINWGAEEAIVKIEVF